MENISIFVKLLAKGWKIINLCETCQMIRGHDNHIEHI